jgi:sugar lactone lactonase YvrE
MKTTLLASGLGFPESPVAMGDGRVVFCDGNAGELLVYASRWAAGSSGSRTASPVTFCQLPDSHVVAHLEI